MHDKCRGRWHRGSHGWFHAMRPDGIFGGRQLVHRPELLSIEIFFAVGMAWHTILLNLMGSAMSAKSLVIHTTIERDSTY